MAVPQKLLVVSRSDGDLCIMVKQKIDCGSHYAAGIVRWRLYAAALKDPKEIWQDGTSPMDSASLRGMLPSTAGEAAAQKAFALFKCTVSRLSRAAVKFPKYTLHMWQKPSWSSQCFSFPHRIYGEFCADFCVFT